MLRERPCTLLVEQLAVDTGTEIREPLGRSVHQRADFVMAELATSEQEQHILLVRQMLAERGRQLVEVGQQTLYSILKFLPFPGDHLRRIGRSALLSCQHLQGLAGLSAGHESLSAGCRPASGIPPTRRAADGKGLFAIMGNLYHRIRVRRGPGGCPEIVCRCKEVWTPGFIADVQLQLPKASKELLRTCCLLKLGFSNPDIAIIMKTPRQTVWHRVTKLRKIMGTLLEVPESHEKERL